MIMALISSELSTGKTMSKIRTNMVTSTGKLTTNLNILNKSKMASERYMLTHADFLVAGTAKTKFILLPIVKVSKL